MRVRKLKLISEPVTALTEREANSFLRELAEKGVEVLDIQAQRDGDNDSLVMIVYEEEKNA